MTIDLNCDLGEGEPLSRTEVLMQAITSCNVACGGHAGDERSMRETVELARRYGVTVGAHPSFADRENFGRKIHPLDARGLRSLLTEQVNSLCRVGGPLHHIKLHGALYNLVERNAGLAGVYAAWVRENFPGIPLIALDGGAVSKQPGIRVAREFFADRAYNDDGTLVPREQPGAVLQDVATICERTVRAVKDGRAETICIHGDTPAALQIARQLRRALQEAGIEVRAF